jgi:aspartate ammonia-lyase
MSSRKQDAQKLVQLAEVATTNADNLQKVTTLLGRFNEAIARLEQQAQELSEANDDLERRLLSLEQRG